MSTFSHLYEERLCRICGSYDREYANGHYILWQTSTRTYAHPACMVEKFGRKEALAKVKHAWQIPLFKKALRFPIVKGDKHPMLKAVGR